jgi:hypothetical protein
MTATRIMKALSLRQPWWWGIRHLGKDVENRDWQPNNPSLHVARRLVDSGERFLFHTSRTMTLADWTSFRQTVSDLFDDSKLSSDFDVAVGQVRMGGPEFKSQLQFGGIVSTARLTCVIARNGQTDGRYPGREEACLTTRCSPWFFGEYGFGLADVVDLPFTPLKGAQGFFDVDVDALGIEVPA